MKSSRQQRRRRKKRCEDDARTIARRSLRLYTAPPSLPLSDPPLLTILSPTLLLRRKLRNKRLDRLVVRQIRNRLPLRDLMDLRNRSGSGQSVGHLVLPRGLLRPLDEGLDQVRFSGDGTSESDDVGCASEGFLHGFAGAEAAGGAKLGGTNVRLDGLGELDDCEVGRGSAVDRRAGREKDDGTREEREEDEVDKGRE